MVPDGVEAGETFVIPSFFVVSTRVMVVPLIFVDLALFVVAGTGHGVVSFVFV